MDQEHYYQKGIQEGIAKNQKDMAVNLYKNGVSIELIAKSSNLSADEVKKIISNNI